MRKYDVSQTGYNPKYPKEALIWSPGSGSEVPEWLIDRAKIKKVSEDSGVELDIRQRTTGEIEILDSGGRDILVRLSSPDSYILFSETHPIMSVTPHQLELLYELHLRK